MAAHPNEQAIRADELREGDVMDNGAGVRVRLDGIKQGPKTITLTLTTVQPITSTMRVRPEQYCPVIERG